MASEKISNYSQRGFGREAKRITGLEPVTAAWKAEMLPLHHIRIGKRDLATLIQGKHCQLCNP